MHADCLDTGMDPERCEVVAAGICPGSACMASTAAFRTCFAESLDCTTMLDNMGAAMLGCSCDLRCEDTDDLSLEQLMAVCFTYPSAVGDDCAEPSASQCMALLTLDEPFCDVDACEYVECQRDIMAQWELSLVCAEPPPSCATMVACDEAENGGGKPAPFETRPLVWRDRPRTCCELHGSVRGKDNTCRISEPPFCIGCDSEPVLCMTTGCGASSSEPCCLSDDGRTEAC